jgi:hypothetical protein
MFPPIPHQHGRAAPGTSVAPQAGPTREAGMMWSFFVASLVLWAFGVVSSHTFGGRIHLLLGVAIGVIVIRIIQGRQDPLV